MLSDPVNIHAVYNGMAGATVCCSSPNTISRNSIISMLHPIGRAWVPLGLEAVSWRPYADVLTAVLPIARMRRLGRTQIYTGRQPSTPYIC
jgi:hypothetical protein